MSGPESFDDDLSEEDYYHGMVDSFQNGEKDMAWAGAKFQEVRFIIKDEFTYVYVLIEALGDCPIGVQGWHSKAFPASIPISDIVPSMAHDDPLSWPLDTPDSINLLRVLKGGCDTRMNAVVEMDRSIRCLALQLPEPVYDDVKKRWDAVLEKLTELDGKAIIR